MLKITLNGRFLAARQTGVQRVATNLTLGLDRLLAQSAPRSDRSWEVRAPRGASQGLKLSSLDFENHSVLTGQAWEQLELPVVAGRGGLVNLCNAGPLLAPSALTMIHDAQAYLTPQSYTPAFLAWYHFTLPRLAAQSRYLLTVSEFSKRMLVKYRVAQEEKILVIPNGVDHILSAASDPDVVARLELKPFSYVFAFGNLQHHKNLDLLLRAFEDPRLKDIKLVVCGPVDWAQLGRAFGVSPRPNILLVDRPKDTQVRALMEAAACLALPSSTEGFGLPALEAMILGCPALVAPAGALPEVCGDAAFYASLDDLDAWITSMARLVEDDAGREERRARSVAHASTYTWDRSAALFAGALDKALG